MALTEQKMSRVRPTAMVVGGMIGAGFFSLPRTFANAIGALGTVIVVTVFVFIGIEGASVRSRFARERADVGRAKILGFIIATSLMVLFMLLPYSVPQRADIAGLRQLSMTGVLDATTWSYAPYAVFSIVSPLLTIAIAYAGIRMLRVPAGASTQPAASAPAPRDSGT